MASVDSRDAAASATVLTDSITCRIRGQRRRQEQVKPLEPFYRNLEEALDQRRAAHNSRCLAPSDWQESGKTDFASNDILSWNASGALRTEFLAQLEKHPDFSPGTSGSRLLDGNYAYIEAAEQEISAFHGAETGLILNSGFDANVAVWTAIPRPGDAIIYDSLVHASTNQGIAQSLAIQKAKFPHNNLEAFRNTLCSILDSQPLIRQGKRSVLVAVEGVYSMDGDVCPLHELVDIASDVSQGQGNVQFVIDEAHSTGLLGPRGAGLVCALGLEAKIAIRVHTFGKCMGSSGAIVLGNPSIKTALLSFAPSTSFSTAPSFTFVAAIKAGYNLLQSANGNKAQQRVQYLARLFYTKLTLHSCWKQARASGLLEIPLAEEWDKRPFLTHISFIKTREKYLYWLYFHMVSAGFWVWPAEHPIVPKGESRIKISLHAGNTDEQVEGLIGALFSWVQEIMDIEAGKSQEIVTRAAKMVYTWMGAEGLDGFGLVES
ncbi:hypothetical protein CDD81_1248 [Ophiocordyceps australis]|uniref:Aminotransferase class I/classII large domain-containing protein n=1 Tax=Ophiocordyceps australis TaxID=1399860 RepID=A0A2C5XBB3_9HYPO|nr:hypothetical protein CDD81_1248 [Ophiocordyceps australis]